MTDDINPNPVGAFRQKFNLNAIAVKPESYHTGMNYKIRWRKQLDSSVRRPPTFLNVPMRSSDIRRRFKKKMKKNDFHWKKVDVLVKFLDPSGNLKSRWQTRLPSPVHRRMSEVVKHSRNIGLLPIAGVITPTDKLPLRSQFEDRDKYRNRQIDPLTGSLMRVSDFESDTDKARFLNL